MGWLKYLREKFYTSDVVRPYGWKEYVEIFENPTRSEIESISKTDGTGDVRFCFDSKLKMFAWRADILHHVIQKKFLRDMTYAFLHEKKKPSVIQVDDDSYPSPKTLSDAKKKKLETKIKKVFPKTKRIVSMFTGKGYRI